MLVSDLSRLADRDAGIAANGFDHPPRCCAAAAARDHRMAARLADIALEVAFADVCCSLKAAQLQLQPINAAR